VRHPLPVLLVLGSAAVSAGARSFVVIGQWVAHQPAQVLAGLGVLGPGPAEPTIRGARSTRTEAPHLVAAFDHDAGTVLGQVQVPAKSNEIPAVRTLLASLELAGCVVTVDAMHTQHGSATAITRAGGDYVFTVKANQRSLFAACKNLPWAQVRAHSHVSTGHGRRTRRTIKVLAAPARVGFTGATQIAQVPRSLTRAGRKSVEVVHLITCADHHAAPPATLAAWIQDHWGIQNQLHRVRDVSYDEDRPQVRTANAPHVMATLRNTAISLLRITGATNIAAGLRQHAHDPDLALTILLTS
jgi:predicted transposase YbfD/YdcC